MVARTQRDPKALAAPDLVEKAMCARFFAALDRTPMRTRRGSLPRGIEFIEGFCNTRCLHSALGYRPPSNCEKMNHAA